MRPVFPNDVDRLHCALVGSAFLPFPRVPVVRTSANDGIGKHQEQLGLASWFVSLQLGNPTCVARGRGDVNQLLLANNNKAFVVFQFSSRTGS